VEDILLGARYPSSLKIVPGTVVEGHDGNSDNLSVDSVSQRQTCSVFTPFRAGGGGVVADWLTGVDCHALCDDATP